MQKKTKLRKSSKLCVAKMGRQLWVYCRMIIRKKYGNDCYICDRKGLEGGNWHTAHLIPKAACGAYLKYDLRNLRPCCYHCNINLGGNGAEFMRKMIIREGQEYVDQIFRDRNLITKEKEYYPMLIEKYKLMIELCQ